MQGNFEKFLKFTWHNLYWIDVFPFVHKVVCRPTIFKVTYLNNNINYILFEKVY